MSSMTSGSSRRAPFVAVVSAGETVGVTGATSHHNIPEFRKYYRTCRKVTLSNLLTLYLLNCLSSRECWNPEVLDEHHKFLFSFVSSLMPGPLQSLPGRRPSLSYLHAFGGDTTALVYHPWILDPSIPCWDDMPVCHPRTFLSAVRPALDGGSICFVMSSMTSGSRHSLPGRQCEWKELEKIKVQKAVQEKLPCRYHRVFCPGEIVLLPV